MHCRVEDGVMVASTNGLSAADLRTLDVGSIHKFVVEFSHLLQGSTLDWGCGKQPYRHLCGADYVGYDANYYEYCIPEGRLEDFDAILCTVAIQEFPNPAESIVRMVQFLRPGGHLVLVYHPNWREVEPVDHWRISMAGMEAITKDLVQVAHRPLLRITTGHFHLNMTCGYVGRKG